MHRLFRRRTLGADDEEGRGIIRVYGYDLAVDESLGARSAMQIVDHPILAGAGGFGSANAQLGFLIAGDFISRPTFGEPDFGYRRGGRRTLA